MQNSVKIERIGEKWSTINYGDIIILVYTNAVNCDVKFENGTIVKGITYQNIKMEKKVIRIGVIGSRNFSDYSLFCEKLEYLTHNIKEDIIYISGACKSGADKMIANYCLENNKQLIEYPPNYIKYSGKHALFKRNDEIVANCDYLISYWDGISRGASYTHNKAIKRGINVKVVKYVDK